MLLFIGGGNMASALVHGCTTSGFANSSEIAISCQSKTTEGKWRDQGFEHVFISAASMISRFPHGVVVLAVKPQSRYDVYHSLSSSSADLVQCPLLISILAGISIDVLQKELFEVGYEGPIVRLMPNVASAIGSGASILCAAPNVRTVIIDIVEALASKTGLCVEVNSSTFNAYGVISGSAPAWAYLFIESLADGAVLTGCSRDTAVKLAAQSLLGAAEMILASGEHPGALKDKVCSPGGTTIAGIRELEKSGFRSAVIEAVKAATERADNMS